MSWSISIIGNPEDVAAELEAHKDSLTGYSLVEYADALPWMLGLLQQNFNTDYPQSISLTANGHGAEKDGKPHYRNVNMELKSHHFKIARKKP